MTTPSSLGRRGRAAASDPGAWPRPTPVFETGLAAALARGDADVVSERLRTLADAALIDAAGPDHYRLSDLTARFAAARLQAEDSETESRDALDRAMRWLAVRTAFQPEMPITRDFWTADDTLGYAPYADAIAAFIRHRGTPPPLTIGVTAPWGAGKTSLMRMVQERLDPRADRERWTPTSLLLSDDARKTLAPNLGRDADQPVTNRELLQRTTEPPIDTDDVDARQLDVLGAGLQVVSKLSLPDKTFLEAVLGMGGGYVLDFTNTSLAQLFDGLAIDANDVWHLVRDAEDRHGLLDHLRHRRGILLFTFRKDAAGDDVFAGHIFIRMVPNDEPELEKSLPRIPLLMYLRVMDEHQRNGLGRQLVDAAEKILIRKKQRMVALGVDPKNAQAIALYESLSFTRWRDEPIKLTAGPYGTTAGSIGSRRSASSTGRTW